MIRGIVLIFFIVAVMIAAVGGVLWAGYMHMKSEQQIADAGWQKPVAAPQPASAPATDSSSDDDGPKKQTNIGLWAEQAHLTGDARLVDTPNYRPQKTRKGGGVTIIPDSAMKHHLSGFRTSDDSATWDVVVPADGEYQLSLTYACDRVAEGAHFLIRVADQDVMFETVGSQHRYSFHVSSIQRLTLKAGTTTLLLRPTLNSPKQPVAIDVRGVQLIPLSEQ